METNKKQELRNKLAGYIIRIGNYLAKGFTIFVIIYITSFFFTATAQGKWEPFNGSLFGYSLNAAVGDSMVPTFKDKLNYLIVKKEKIENVGIGDVIIYHLDTCDGEPVQPISIVHRVIEIKNNDGEIGIITKGDGNDFIDYCTVTEKHLKGVVKYSSRITLPRALADILNPER